MEEEEDIVERPIWVLSEKIETLEEGSEVAVVSDGYWRYDGWSESGACYYRRFGFLLITVILFFCHLFGSVKCDR